MLEWRGCGVLMRLGFERVEVVRIRCSMVLVWLIVSYGCCFCCVRVTELKGVVASIEKGVTTKEMRLMARANRQMLLVRRQLKASTVNAFLKHALPAGSDALARLLPFAAAVCTLNWTIAL